MDIYKRYKIHPNVAWRELGGKLYVYSNNGQELHVFNEVGEFLWKLIANAGNDGIIIKNLVDAMANEYDVSADDIKDDVNEFLLALESKVLVVVDGGDTLENDRK